MKNNEYFHSDGIIDDFAFGMCRELGIKVERRGIDSTSKAFEALEGKLGVGYSVLSDAVLAGKSGFISDFVPKAKEAIRKGTKLTEDDVKAISSSTKTKEKSGGTAKAKTPTKKTTADKTKTEAPKKAMADKSAKSATSAATKPSAPASPAPAAKPIDKTATAPAAEAKPAEAKPADKTEAETPKTPAKVGAGITVGGVADKPKVATINFKSPAGEAIHSAFESRLTGVYKKPIEVFGVTYKSDDGGKITATESDGTVRDIESSDAVANEIFDKIHKMDVGDSIKYYSGDTATCLGRNKFSIPSMSPDPKTAMAATLCFAKRAYAGDSTGRATITKLDDSDFVKAISSAKSVEIKLGDKTITKDESDSSRYLSDGKGISAREAEAAVDDYIKSSLSAGSKFDICHSSGETKLSIESYDDGTCVIKHTSPEREEALSPSATAALVKKSITPIIRGGTAKRVSYMSDVTKDTPKEVPEKYKAATPASLKHYDERIAEYEAKHPMPEAHKAELNDVVRRIVSSCKICSRTDEQYIPDILENGLKNQIQLKEEGDYHSHGAHTVEGRKRMSYDVFGTEKGSKGSDYEKYGFLWDGSSRIGASGYGDALIVFKSDISDRCTWTCDDSLGHTKGDNVAGKLGKDATYHGLSYSWHSDLYSRFKSAKSLSDITDGCYPEVQFHGHFAAKEIESISFTKRPSKKTIDAMDKYGIKWSIRSER